VSESAAVANERGRRKVRTGVVVSDAMEKTVVVRIASQTKHPLYGKIVRRSTRLKAHDDRFEAHVGDTVRIVETRPLSRTKRWRVVEIIERGK
jgi:small subunit ribosomal protein S17